MRYYLNTSVSVGTTAVRVLPDREGLNIKRISYVLQNISSAGQKITLSTGETIAAGTGRTLSVGGSEDRTPDQYPTQTFIMAIADAAGGTLAVYEESEDIQ